MKKIFFLILLISILSNAFTQAVVNPSGVYDSPIVTPYPSILQTPFEPNHVFKQEGSPLLFEDWRLGTVILLNHKQYDNVRLNFVPSVNKFYCNLNDTSYELLNTIDEIRIKDFRHPDDHNYDMIFKNSINGGNMVKPGTFVEILSTGKITMIKKYIKGPDGSNSTNGIVTSTKRYTLHTNIFAIVDNGIKVVRLNRHFLEKLTSDREDQMKAFLKSKELNLRREADFRQAVSYYNYISSLSFSKKTSI